MLNFYKSPLRNSGFPMLHCTSKYNIFLNEKKIKTYYLKNICFKQSKFQTFVTTNLNVWIWVIGMMHSTHPWVKFHLKDKNMKWPGKHLFLSYITNVCFGDNNNLKKQILKNFWCDYNKLLNLYIKYREKMLSNNKQNIFWSS